MLRDIDTPKVPVLPASDADDPTIRAKADAFAARHAELRQASTRRDQLERGRAEAIRTDREAAAVALRAGRRDPGTKNLAKHDTDTEAARRTEETLQLAVAADYQELRGAAEQHGPGQLDTYRELIDQRRAALADALDAVAEAHAALGDAHARRAWLDALMQGRPVGYIPAKFAATLASLDGPSGEPLHVGAVLDALRQLTTEPTKRTWPVAA